MVAAFQQAYASDLGSDLCRIGPKPFVDDGNSFWALAGIPAITHGPRAGGQHTRRGVGFDRRPGPRGRTLRLDAPPLLPDALGRPDGYRTHHVRPDRRGPDDRGAFLRQIFVRDQMAEWSKQPLVMARADGVYYWDVHGKRYLDAISGIYVASVGHNNRRVIEAIRRQLDILAFSPPMHGTNPVAVQLANLLAELAPGDLSTVKFQCGGSEVTEAAIKLARQYHRSPVRRASTRSSAATSRGTARPWARCRPRG